MKRALFGLLLLVVFIVSAGAQEDIRFTVEVSTDSILYGNYFKVTFTLENAKGGEFSAPDFSQFIVVSGPNKASSMSMINGQVSQSISYSYYLEPKDIGNFYILPASIDLGDRMLETQPVEVMVVPNPEGIKQSPESRKGLRMDRFGPDGFDLRSDDLPDLDQMHDLFRQMFPKGGTDGSRMNQDSLPSFDLDEFFRMMPELRRDIPDQLKKKDQPKEPGRKKKRKIYKV